MATSYDLGHVAGVTDEMSEALTTTFAALANWRDEVETANKRYLGKVLDRFAKTARMMGWPEEAIAANREIIGNVAQTQVKAIDEIMETWKRQLVATKTPMAVPNFFPSHLTKGPASAFSAQNFQALGPMAPWMMWLEAAETWQRTWSAAWDTSNKDRWTK
jgi:hypothetical protein